MTPVPTAGAISELPFIDVHSTALAAPPEVVFDALERIGPRLGTDRVSSVYARLVGTEGGLYRAAVIGSGGHRVAMKLLLRGLKGTIERRAG